MQPVEEEFRWYQHFTLTWQTRSFKEAAKGKGKWPFMPGDEQKRLLHSCREAITAAKEAGAPAWALEGFSLPAAQCGLRVKLPVRHIHRSSPLDSCQCDTGPCASSRSRALTARSIAANQPGDPAM